MKRWTSLLMALALVALTACTPAAPAATPEPTVAVTETTAPTPEPTEEPTPEPTEALAAPEAAGGFPKTLTDALGRSVTIGKEPQVIVSLTAANTEIMFALGMGGKVAAVDSYSDYPAQALALPKVGDYSGANIEAVMALTPDLVLAGDKLQQDAIDKLAALGLCVIATEAASFDAIPDSVTLIADAVGADASHVLAKLDVAKATVAMKIKDKPQPTVYYAVAFGEWGDYTAGQGSYIDDVITLAGGVNIAGDVPTPWPSFSVEQIMLSDPDIIVIGGDDAMVAQFCEGEQYKALKAVKDGKVFAIDVNAISRPGPRIADALGAMADILHP